MNEQTNRNSLLTGVVIAISMMAVMLLLSVLSVSASDLPEQTESFQSGPNTIPLLASITSVQDGDWDDPNTWSPATVPGPGDDVMIVHQVTIWDNNQRTVQSLSIIGSVNGTLHIGGGALYGTCDVNVQASANIINDGLIKAGTWSDRGCDVVLESTGGVIENYDVIVGGWSPVGCPINGRGANGGNVIINGAEIYNNNGTIYGGDANKSACQGGGDGGSIFLTAVYTMTHLNGTIIGGKGGNASGWAGISPGIGGYIYVFGDPLILNGGVIQGPGGVWIDPPDIILSGDLVVEGSNVSIFSPEGWTIAISETMDGVPSISATHAITLATGISGTVDLTGIPTDTQVFQVVSGTMTIQSDVITSTEPISDMVGGSVEVDIEPSVDIFEVAISSASRVYRTVVAGETFTLSFRVQNIGNITDTYNIQFDTQDPTWTLSPAAMFTQELGIFESKDVVANVSVPASFSGGTNIVSITTSSPNASASAATFISGCVTLSEDVDFSYEPARARVGRKVTFQAVPTTTNAAYIWDFGDGQMDTGAKVVHRFETADTFSVTLRVENDCDSKTVAREVMAANWLYLPIVLREQIN
ncbi:MAG: PKD domain-containing protein [bacterium]|nr:PKD domain-containing protein [bacterium]